MNILIPDSWLREFLETNATPKDIQKCLSLCGPSVERLTSYILPPKLGGRIKEGSTKKVGEGDIDWVYDIEVTTNRVDCMSVLGIAREAAAILPQFGFKTSFKFPSPKIRRGIKGEVKGEVRGEISKIPGLEIINDPKLSQRVLALKVSGVKVTPSPSWLGNRLEMIGLRPLNNLVDITNYLMWEIGHPTHVFDFNRLSSGRMIIREAKKGEHITTLDDQTYTMVGGEVIIDDGQGRIIDLPSIMGTANSVVVDSTSTALFFIEDILANKVRFASMTHSIRTQAATLMEKGVDPNLGDLAISRIIELVKELLPGAKIEHLIDIYPHPQLPSTVNLSLTQISKHIGVSFTKTQVSDILTPLGFETKIQEKDFVVTPPSWRSNDIKIAEDVTEEIARVFGYHNLPSQLMPGVIPENRGPDKVFYWESRIKYLLKHLGLTEVYTYSLVDKDAGLKLKNPLSSEWEYLRTSLTPSHQKIIQENSGRVEELNFFEIANVYLPRKNDLPEEQSRLILSTINTDYLHFKGIIENIFIEMGLSIPSLNIQINSGVLIWETSLLPLIEHATPIHTYTPISKFAPVIEDINVPYSDDYAAVVKHIKSLSSLIQKVEYVDLYEQKLTLRLTFHSVAKQLSSEDIAPIRQKITSL